MKNQLNAQKYSSTLLLVMTITAFYWCSTSAHAQIVVSETLINVPTTQEIAAQELELKEKQLEYQKSKLNLQRTEALDLETARLEIEIRKLELIKARRDLMVQETKEQLNMLLEGDVLFDVNSFAIKTGAEPILGQVAMILSEYPKGKVTVTGFADSTGTAQNNLVLSRKRGESVKTYLLDHAGKIISSERVIAQGKGEISPVASNESTAGRQLNRRVEITITKEMVQ